MKQELRELRGRTATDDVFGRTVASCFRTYCFQRFGGLGWVHWYAALGDVSPELVKLVQEHISRVIRTEARSEPTAAATGDPRLSARSAAMRAGENAPPLRGVQHAVTLGKKLRKEAKNLDNRIAKLHEAFYRGEPTVSWWAWNLMLQNRQVPQHHESY